MITTNPFQQLEELIDERFNELKALIIGNNEPTPKVEEVGNLYSIKELADFLRCSIASAHKLKKSGQIPYTQFGRKLIFSKGDVLMALKDKKSRGFKR